MKKAIYFNSKRFVSLILIIALFASSGILSSCSVERKNPTALTLNGIEISNDVFTYFIDVAMTELDANADENSILTKATALTETYFKTNSLAKKNGVTLSTASKASVSEKVFFRYRSGKQLRFPGGRSVYPV